MKNNCPTNNKSAKGFTLIELLIVIAVLGVLAAVVLVAINPLEQLARGRDSGRKSTVGQLKNAVQAYYTSHNATWLSHNGGWVSNLTVAGEVKSVPAAVSFSTGNACSPATIYSNAVEKGWCYYTDYNEAVVYTRLESKSEQTKCSSANSALPDPFFAWSSEQGQAGTVCMATGAQPTALTFVNYYK